MPDGDRRGGGAGASSARRLTLQVAVLVISTVLLAAPPALAQTCTEPSTVDLITGASASDVVGVVEYEVIAENTSGFGASVGATRRIWGGVVADRWMVVPSGSGCAETPVSGLGDRWYLLVGPDEEAGGPTFGIPSTGELSDLEAGALASIVGEPVTLEIGSLDRAMAWTRVNWWLLGAGLVPLIAIVAVVRRRRSGARRDYLF